MQLRFVSFRRLFPSAFVLMRNALVGVNLAQAVRAVAATNGTDVEPRSNGTGAAGMLLSTFLLLNWFV
jgi:hypothetical protein